jgi:hypothetical protein
VVATAFTLADRELFAIDVKGEQHWSGSVGCAVFIGSGAGIVAAVAGASVHDCQYPRAGTAETGLFPESIALRQMRMFTTSANVSA